MRKNYPTIFNNYFPKSFDLAFDFDFPISSQNQWALENGQYSLEVDLPGIKKEDVSMEVKDGVLKISATRSFKNGNSSSSRSYEGSFSIPKDLDLESIDASLESGVLNIRGKQGPDKDTKRIVLK